MYKVLIIGANFINKGAQSMLFITMDEIRKRINDADITFATFENENDFDLYRFKTVYYNPQSVQIALYPGKKLRISLIEHLKNIAKWIAGTQYRKYLIPVSKLSDISKQIHEYDLMIDISGFGLGSKWGITGSEQYLDNIRLAQKYSIPIVLMPQSFGPFDYEDATQRNKLLTDIQEVLKYPVRIYAREEEGFKYLANDMKLSNVRLSSDLVLQNKGIDLHNVLKEIPAFNVPEVKENAVAIIPNIQCFRHGDKEKNLQLYSEIINTLSQMGKQIYLFRHSSEDLSICEEIARKAQDKVILLKEDFSCFEYDKLIKKFDFVICSRYHGIVHAYRNYIPSIALGWAIKYKELASLVGQVNYVFDITDEQFTVNSLLNAIRRMDAQKDQEREIIREKVLEIQKDNCFKVLEEGI